ncbi:D-Ala-D-Ala carboxypeptidase family metallohydrolase [Parabacteroides sp. W1-Q-101]|uniref:D-Ala-D-Ala carboxypeptidase family metallohydrolase n=1 Tax=Parabacteroides TaxID=375288 RepID=UPI001F33733A|nr:MULTISPECIES: D-Ala-D-Ala carboxypeptidase family metallohydrolase [Parabacteroides]MCM0720069.1 D-Ala-D-Ala carboxypeptidase family metallohydrolase [Parabacteroides sp. W1-Q-101]
MEPLRQFNGRPIAVLSGYRSDSVNRLAGGVSTGRQYPAEIALLQGNKHHSITDTIRKSVQTVIVSEYLDSSFRPVSRSMPGVRKPITNMRLLATSLGVEWL